MKKGLIEQFREYTDEHLDIDNSEYSIEFTDDIVEFVEKIDKGYADERLKNREDDLFGLLYPDIEGRHIIVIKNSDISNIG